MSNRSDSVAQLAEALAKAQGMITAALKDTEGQVGNQRRKYADLASVWEACRKPLSMYGLSVSQLIGGGADTLWLETYLMHASGEWMCSIFPLPAVGANQMQAAGSAITYARRYSLAAIVGVAPDDGDTPDLGDDDGEAAKGQPISKGKPRNGVKPVEQPPADPRDAAWARLIGTEGFVPDATDLPACAAFVAQLMGKRNCDLARCKAEHFDMARTELEGRTRGRKAFFAKWADQGRPDNADDQRAYISVIAKRPVASRATVTADEWPRVLDSMDAPTDVPADAPEEPDPFGDDAVLTAAQ